MRSLVIVAAVLLVSVPAGAQPGRSRLLSRYDKLERCTTVQASVFRYGPDGGRNLFTMDAFAMHRDTAPPPEPIPEATFLFGAEHGAGEDGFGGDDAALSLVVDDSVALRYPARGTRPFPAQHLRGGTFERLYARVPAADLRRMALATRITGKIAQREFALDSAHIGILRQLSDFVARSSDALAPVRGTFDGRDCDSYSWSPNYAPYKPEKDAPRR